jgi:hypothetical protein
MTTEERFARIENILDHVVDRREQLDAALTTLAESHIKTQEELQATAAMIGKLSAQVAATER